ncbi:MAG: MarR family transcriptional regulator [Gemmataceae bacterium]
MRLNAPWVPSKPDRLDDLAISRGGDNVLTYDDDISLQVEVLDPVSYESVEDLVVSARDAAGPGRVVLVAGAVPVEWRAALRQAELSFIDLDGVVEIVWPRLRVSARRLGKDVVRHRRAVPLQKGHALVAEELLLASVEGSPPTITELARRAGVDKSIASRTVAQLAEQGLVAREQSRRRVPVFVVDPDSLAELLAERTAWPGHEVVGGYVWGRNIWDTAATISRNAADAGIELAITGRTGAAFLGVLGTSSPREVRCWATLNGRPLEEVAAALGLTPAPRESMNIRLSADPWRIGVHRRGNDQFDEWTAMVAHPFRVWCDVHSEERGREFASQLWGKASHAWR